MLAVRKKAVIARKRRCTWQSDVCVHRCRDYKLWNSDVVAFHFIYSSTRHNLILTRPMGKWVLTSEYWPVGNWVLTSGSPVGRPELSIGLSTDQRVLTKSTDQWVLIQWLLPFLPFKNADNIPNLIRRQIRKWDARPTIDEKSYSSRTWYNAPSNHWNGAERSNLIRQIRKRSHCTSKPHFELSIGLHYY